MKLSMILSQLSTGMAGTISIFVLTLVFSLPLGLLIAFGRMSKNRIVSGIFRLYISLMRGTSSPHTAAVTFQKRFCGWP